MWLRDWLGQDLASGDMPVRARIFTYGYPSKVAKSFDNASLHDLGQGLLSHLAGTRRSSSKPLVLVGHSLGGLVVKQALKDAFHSEDESRRDIFDSCALLVMFGVPNLGLDNAAFLEMARGHKNEALMSDLGTNSHYLRELERDMKNILKDRDLPVVTIWETEDSPTNQASLHL